MEDYRPYLPARVHEEFDAFCKLYNEVGTHSFDLRALRERLDPDQVEDWEETVVKPGRLAGNWDPHSRIEHQDRDGVSAEVVIPDFGVPFELYPPLMSYVKGYKRTPEQISLGGRAYNRWLADFCSTAPDRLGGMAMVSFVDVPAAVEEIRWARDAGLKGLMLPMFDETSPVFDSRFEPIWDVLEELDMIANSHIAISSTTTHVPAMSSELHPAAAMPMFNRTNVFFCHEILTHMIWGGVFERHPRLQLVMTEQGSGWVVGDLENMDWVYEQSYQRRDVREAVRHKPSEYFERQCHLGSSLFSLAEAKARREIGVEKMMIGTDYPHHEGTWAHGSIDYLRATLGAAQVPPEDARLMLGLNAARVFGFDVAALEPVAARVGPPLLDILTPPVEEKFPRGDVTKPLSLGATG
jgi:predicted TIM-barrel fold metal-dependent hydrolase